MSNIYCDKYFTKSKLVAKKAGINPTVKYRVFGRFDGIAALEPVKKMLKVLAPNAKVTALPEGTPFKAKETMMIIEGKFQELVELETMYLWWSALPCYCANEASKLLRVAEGKTVLDFHARHLYDPTSVALASYGASVAGIKGFSTDVGANALKYLDQVTLQYAVNSGGQLFGFDKEGVGTTPHALIAIFRGNYREMAKAYVETFPDEPFVALIDYNNQEIDDTIDLLGELGDKLAGVRIDTCGENYAQVKPFRPFDPDAGHAQMTGVTVEAVQALRKYLDLNGGKHTKVYVSSGFNAEKTDRFMQQCPEAFNGIGTGSFIPKGPTCTADIFEIDGEEEYKKGREWGYAANDRFYEIVNEENRD